MGYFSIIPNIGTAFASLVPLYYAPYVTLILSIVIQIINIYLIFYNPHKFWGLTKNKAYLFCILLFLPFSEEVFLNTICSQFHLQLSVFLMIYLYQDTKPSNLHLLFYLLSFLSGGVGILTFIIFSIFIKRSNFSNYKTVFYLLSIGLFIQGFFYSISQTPRLHSLEPKYYLQILVSKHILGPSFGYSLEYLYYGIRSIKDFLSNNNLLMISDLIKISHLKILLALSGATLVILNIKSFYKKTNVILPALILSMLFVFLSLKNGSDSFLSFHGGGRYFYASNFIFFMGLYEVLVKNNNINKYLKTIILSWYVFIGVQAYFKHPEILAPQTPLQKQLDQKIIILAPSTFVLQINPEL